MLSLPRGRDTVPWSPAGAWGETANGMVGDPTASTEIWGVPWDQQVLLILPARRKGGCEYAKDKLGAACCSVVLAVVLILLT